MRTISPWPPSAERDRASIAPLASSTGALSDAELAEAELDQVVAAAAARAAVSAAVEDPGAPPVRRGFQAEPTKSIGKKTR